MALASAASGLVGVTNSKRNYTGAVLGYNTSATTDSVHVGVYGTYNTAGFGTGVVGVGYNGNILTTLDDIGVYGSANDYGVYGQSTNGYGVYSNGDIYATGTQTALGTKSASVPTSKGNQLVYCMESPGIWFEDFGNAKLVNGATTVSLDPLFLETVKIDNEHPMVVTVTPMGDCKGLYVIPGKTGFEVRELQGGTANIQFSYRISAKRLNYQDHRFGKDKNPNVVAKTNYVAPTPIEPVAEPTLETKKVKSNIQNAELDKRIQNTIGR